VTLTSPEEYVVSVMVLVPGTDGAWRPGDIMPRVATLLDKVDGERFAAATKRSEKVLSGTAVASSVFASMTHSTASRRSSEPGRRVTVSLTPSDDRKLGVLSINVFSDDDPGDIERAWQLALKVGQSAVIGLSPTAAFVNGRIVDEGADVFPSLRGIADGKFPKAITPWTYLGPLLLEDPLREELAALPAAHSGSIGRGWGIRCVSHLTDPLPPELHEGLRRLSVGRVAYITPILPGERR
jgi:hypothetical protein